MAPKRNTRSSSSSFSSSNEKQVKIKTEKRESTGSQISDDYANIAAKKPRTSIIKETPDEFKCPITHDIMVDLVITPGGYTFERKSILHSLKNGNNKISLDPSRMIIESDLLRENRGLRQSIERFIASDECSDGTKDEYNAAKKASEVFDMAAKKALDMKEAEKLFEEGKILEAAKLEYPQAMGKMAENYFDGINGYEKDYVKGFEFATRAANEGNEKGMFKLERCNHQSLVVHQNYAVEL